MVYFNMSNIEFDVIAEQEKKFLFQLVELLF